MGLGWSSQRYEISTRIDGKTVVITGASSGIGKFTAQELYRIGGRVIIADINIIAAEKAAEEIRNNVSACDPKTQVGELVIKKIDLSSMESVRSFAHDIIQSEEQINILINNAGVMMREHQMTDDGFEKTFETNYLGHFYLTYFLLPKILRSTPSRIIGVASASHRRGYIHWDDLNLEKNYNMMAAYAQSKTAVILFIRELSRRLEGTGVSAYSLTPSPTLTTIFHGPLASYLGWQPTWLHPVLEKINNTFHLVKTVEEGAATELYCALDRSLQGESGFYYADCARAEVSEPARNDDDARRLWNESIKMLGIEDIDIKMYQATS